MVRRGRGEGAEGGGVKRSKTNQKTSPQPQVVLSEADKRAIDVRVSVIGAPTNLLVAELEKRGFQVRDLKKLRLDLLDVHLLNAHLVVRELSTNGTPAEKAARLQAHFLAITPKESMLLCTADISSEHGCGFLSPKDVDACPYCGDPVVVDTEKAT